MPSLKDRLNSGLKSARARRPFLDHVVRTVQHYSAVKGNLQAGAVTYFAFLSFFPLLALGFAVIGYAAKVYPDAQDSLVKALQEVLPNMVVEKPEPGKIAISSLQDAAPGILSIGLPVLLYSALGWISAMRDALLVVFELPPKEQPNIIFGKLRDLVSLALIGVTMVVSVAVSGVVVGFSEDILDFVKLGKELSPALTALSVLVGLAANMVLFFALFKLLAHPHAPTRSLWSGALLGALGFEILKQLSQYLLASTKDQPAFQAFGIALILVVWINYFSRVVMYAAAWAHTSTGAREVRDKEEVAAAAKAARTRVDLHKTPAAASGVAGTATVARSFAAGGATAVALIAVLKRRKKS